MPIRLFKRPALCRLPLIWHACRVEFALKWRTVDVYLSNRSCKVVVHLDNKTLQYMRSLSLAEMGKHNAANPLLKFSGLRSDLRHAVGF